MPNEIKIYTQKNVITIQKQKNTQEALTKSLIEDVLQKQENITIFHFFPEKCLMEFAIQCNIIEASGGIVINDFHDWLMIYRLGFWDLPKGKIEHNEHPLYTAKREILEECGVEVSTNSSTFIDVTYHVYKQNNEIMLKRTYWYMFYVENKITLIPQIEENIEKIEWINKNEWKSIKNSTYLSIINLVEKINIV